MAKKEISPNPILPSIRRLLKISGRYTLWLYSALLFDTILAAILILNTTFLRYAFDSALASDTQSFWLFGLLTLGLTVPNIIFNFLRTSTIGRFSERSLAKLRTMIASHVTKLPISYLEHRHSGDMLSVLNADLDKVKGLYANHLLDFFTQSIRWLKRCQTPRVKTRC